MSVALFGRRSRLMPVYAAVHVSPQLYSCNMFLLKRYRSKWFEGKGGEGKAH